MASDFFVYLCTLLTFSISFHRISAVDYQVYNLVPKTPGGMRFEKEIGIPYTKQIMGPINKFIWSTVFQQNNPSDRKHVDTVIVYIVMHDEADGSTWGNNKINVSSTYLKKFDGKNLKRDFTSLLYHEMTHVFQWDGQGRTPSPLLEGIAEFTTIKANYTQEDFVKPGEGNKWDQGYDYTARFLEYCDGITPGFVAKLNKKMRYTYTVKYFNELTGKSVDQLWKDYKAKYGRH